MAVLDQAAASAQKFAIPMDTIKSIIGPIIWKWMNQHGDDVLLRVQRRIIGIPISHTFYVRDARGLVETLIGPDSSGIIPGVPA